MHSVIALLFFIPLLLSTVTHGSHWVYEGASSGPDHWGDLKEEYRECKAGRNQSPVNLDLDKANYEPYSEIIFLYRATPLKVVNNGHTFQMDYLPGSAIDLGTERFWLKQAHFHSPSEHTLGGKSFDLEVHLVHQNAYGHLAVVGVLVDKGKHNVILNRIWRQFGPIKEAKEVQEPAAPSPDDLPFNAIHLLPKDRTYFSYSGSLTTPPCTEGVRWQVMIHPIEASGAQIDWFRRYFPKNARPLQPLLGRKVLHNFY